MASNSVGRMRFNDFIMLSFFPVVMMYMLLQFSGFRFPILGVYVRLALIYSAVSSFKYVKRSIVLSFLLIYIVYCIFSIVFVLDSSVKLEGYTYDLLNFILPTMAFFIGSNHRTVDNRYYKWYLYSVLFCFGLGLLFYFFSPSWYVEKISNMSYERLGTEISNLDQLHESTRFSSFMYGPYPIEYLGIPAMSFLLFSIYNSRDASFNKRVLFVVSFFIILLSIILCQQRTAWAYLVILIAFYTFISFGKKGSNSLISYLVAGVIVFFVLGVITSNNVAISSVLGSRFEEMSFSTAMAGRTNQYVSLWTNWTRPLLGHGMGSGGAIARVAGLPGASDAGYMKILYANGMFGFILFLGIIIPTFVRTIKHRKRLYIEMHIFFFFLVAMIGSNSLCISLYYSVIFWYAIGRIWNPSYSINQII